MRRLGKRVAVGLLAIVVTGMTLWGMGVLYDALLPTSLRVGLAATFGLATAGTFLGLSHRRRTLLGFVLVWGALVGWWSTISPSNDRDWQPDVAVLPSATVDGDLVTLHNIRHIQYRTATDFTPRYDDKTFDLRRLDSADLLSSYWAGEAIAHLNRLVEQPAFDNTLTTNCTTAILFHARASGGSARYNWQTRFSGYAPAYTYELSRLDTRLPFAELKRLSHINVRVQAASDAPDFSQRIRIGLLMPPQTAGEHKEHGSWGSDISTRDGYSRGR